MKNDGWHQIAYYLDDDAELNRRLSQLLNDACHVFHSHADGNWKSFYKPKYVQSLSAEILVKPSLIRKLLALKDPVISNLTFSAIELNKLNGQQ